jgi:membrane protein implicated in regulation of membrane protease activity
VPHTFQLREYWYSLSLFAFNPQQEINMTETTYWAGDLLQLITDNWYWLIMGWFAASFVLTPIIGRFAGMNREGDKIAEATARRLQAPTVEPPYLLSLDDDDWKEQIEKLYKDHGGES